MAAIPPKNLCLFEPMWKKPRRVCIIGADVEETSLWLVRENSGHGDKDISLSGDETFWGATQYTGRAGVRDSIRHLEDAMQTNKRPAQGGLYIHFGGAKGE